MRDQAPRPTVAYRARASGSQDHHGTSLRLPITDRFS